MSKKSASNKEKDSTNEKIVTRSSQNTRSTLAPPPPSLDASSSSSRLPTSSSAPSQPANGDHTIASQIAQLFSLVGQQASENQALKADVARLSHENVELRTAVGTLRATLEDQEIVMAEISRASPLGGHWIWEGETDQLGRRGGRDGRWLWSSEKHKPGPLRLRTVPPPSLGSIPIELVDAILSFLEQPDLLALCTVSFRLLESASTIVYRRRGKLYLESKQAAVFVAARITDTSISYPRIRSLLLPKALRLIWTEFNPIWFDSLPSSVSHSLPIHSVHIWSGARSKFPFRWSSILQFLDPGRFSLDGQRRDQPPTTFSVTEDQIAFLQHWTQLEHFYGNGELSIPVLVGEADRGETFAFADRLRELVDGEGLVEGCLFTDFSDGTPSIEEVLEESELLPSLRRNATFNPARSAVGLIVRGEVLEDEVEGYSEDGSD